MIQIGIPVVSVVVTTYKRPKLLQQAVYSVLEQDYPNLEIIISDDASNDETASVVETLLSLDNRIRYNRNTTNLGEGINVNHSIGNLAHGKYFSVMQDDAKYINKHFIGQAVTVLEKNPSITFVYGDLEGNGKKVQQTITGKDFWRNWPIECHWLACLFRREPANQIGLLEPTGVINGDSLFLLKMALMGSVASLASCVVQTGFAPMSNYSSYYNDIPTRYMQTGEYLRRAADFATRRNIANTEEAEEWRKYHRRAHIGTMINEYCLQVPKEMAMANFPVIVHAAKECGDDQLLLETLMLIAKNMHEKLRGKE